VQNLRACTELKNELIWSYKKATSGELILKAGHFMQPLVALFHMEPLMQDLQGTRFILRWP
jgi:hypothetical protein